MWSTATRIPCSPRASGSRISGARLDNGKRRAASRISTASRRRFTRSSMTRRLASAPTETRETCDGRKTQKAKGVRLGKRELIVGETYEAGGILGFRAGAALGQLFKRNTLSKIGNRVPVRIEKQTRGPRRTAAFLAQCAPAWEMRSVRRGGHAPPQWLGPPVLLGAGMPAGLLALVVARRKKKGALNVADLERQAEAGIREPRGSGLAEEAGGAGTSRGSCAEECAARRIFLLCLLDSFAAPRGTLLQQTRCAVIFECTAGSEKIPASGISRR
jgi:hypothetical protein